MPFLIVPNEAFGDMAMVWVAAIDESFDPAVTILEDGSNQVPLNSNWTGFVTDSRPRPVFPAIQTYRSQPSVSWPPTT